MRQRATTAPRAATQVRVGARQVVVLGAGADSRAYRFADVLGDVRVWEVDHPATSAWKRWWVRTFFVWEGVVPYFPQDAVDTTLACVARFAAGSSVGFDYLCQEVVDGSSSDPGGRKYLTYLAMHGGPLLSGSDPAMIADHDLEFVDNAGPDELGGCHLGATTGPIAAFSAIAHARVPWPPAIT